MNEDPPCRQYENGGFQPPVTFRPDATEQRSNLQQCHLRVGIPYDGHGPMSVPPSLSLYHQMT